MLTFVRLLARVSDSVILQMIATSKKFTTHITGVQFLTPVSADVLVQIGFHSELFNTVRACIRFFTTMFFRCVDEGGIRFFFS